MRVDESLRPDEKESEREFKLFKNARESMRGQQSLRPNDNESGREFKAYS